MEDANTSQLLLAPPLDYEPPPPLDEDQETLIKFLDLFEQIEIYASPLLLVVGSLGNVTSLVVLSRLSRKVLSTCVYLSVLCVADLLVLLTRCGNPWLANLTGYDVEMTSRVR